MLKFNPDFFQPETRDDFFVDATMKTVWAAELEVLSAIAAVCEKYNISWFADWGTLLGVVRHKGFIPWDDDMDIALKRPDYERLMSVLPKELPPDFQVFNTDTGKGQTQFWGCVTNASTISIEERRLKNFHGCPFVVGVDIFPLDYLPDDEDDRNMEQAIFELIWNTVKLIKNKEDREVDKIEIENALVEIENIFNVTIDREEDLVARLWQLGNWLCSSYQEGEATHIAHYLSRLKNPRIVFEKHWFDETIYLPFENIMIPVPKEYHLVLEAEYGDYNILKRDGTSHDYPFYKKQLEQLRNMVAQLDQEKEK